MSALFCSMSGEAPAEPVVSRKTGHVFEKRLITKFIQVRPPPLPTLSPSSLTGAARFPAGKPLNGFHRSGECPNQATRLRNRAVVGGGRAVSVRSLLLERRRRPSRILSAAHPRSSGPQRHEGPPAASGGLGACSPLVGYKESSGIRYNGGRALTRRRGWLAGLRELPGDWGAADGGRSG